MRDVDTNDIFNNTGFKTGSCVTMGESVKTTKLRPQFYIFLLCAEKQV